MKYLLRGGSPLATSYNLVSQLVMSYLAEVITKIWDSCNTYSGNNSALFITLHTYKTILKTYVKTLYYLTKPLNNKGPYYLLIVSPVRYK